MPTLYIDEDTQGDTYYHDNETKQMVKHHQRSRRCLMAAPVWNYTLWNKYQNFLRAKKIFCKISRKYSKNKNLLTKT